MDATHDAERREKNRTRLKELHPAMRVKVAAVIADMEGHGWMPLIDAQVHRTKEEQARLVRNGVSKVSFSFHNASGKRGEPQSLAVDIIDARWGWDSPRKFWLMLGSSYTQHGLNWGGFFGLKGRTQALRDRLKIRDYHAPGIALGWDVAHGEWSGIPLAAVRLGVRPKLAA